MFSFLIKEKVIQTIVDKITTEVNKTLKKSDEINNLKIDKVISHLESLRMEVSTIERRLESKEIKDNATYGQLRYQVNSLETRLKPKKVLDKSSH